MPIDGIDRDFHFGNAQHPCSRPGVQPIPLAFGVTQVRLGIALVTTNYSIVYLEFETLPGSFGRCPVTSSPGLGEVG